MTVETPRGVASSDVVRDRFAYVDALRGVAILLVLAYEVARHLGAPTTGLLGRLVDEGSRGLDLFFLLSGFGLAYPALSVLRSDGAVRVDLAAYVVRRLARVVPTAVVALLAIVLAPAALALAGQSLAPHPSFAPALAKLPRLLDVERWFTLVATPPVAPGAFWAIAVALRCYVLLPGLLVLWLRSRIAFAAVGVAAVVLDALLRPLHDAGLGELPVFQLGIVAADWRVRHFGFARWGSFLAPGCALIGVLLESLVRPVAGDPFPPDDLGWQAAAFFLVVGAGHATGFERALDRPLLVRLGTASFAIALALEASLAAAIPATRAALAALPHAVAHVPLVGATLTIDAAAIGPATTGGRIVVALVALAAVALGSAVLYALVDRRVVDRGARARIVADLAPVGRFLGRLARTDGTIVLGDAGRDEAWAMRTAVDARYAPLPPSEEPPPRPARPDEPTPEERMLAKRRLADRTRALLADAEYEANRERGVVTPPPANLGYDLPPTVTPSPIAIDATAPDRDDVWSKPRSPVVDVPSPAPATPPPPPATAHRSIAFDRPAGPAAASSPESPVPRDDEGGTA